MKSTRDDIKYAVEVRQVQKWFKRRTVKGGYTTLKTKLLAPFTGRDPQPFSVRNIQVLKGVDLLVPAGKTVGIIGQNGSGKSTLLKILTGIYAPSKGTALVRGRVSALLELGAGFHPEFSGRENIFVNGAILGLTRTEVKAKLEEIIAFAELEDFIDEPVRNYSSGMYMRLAFAVATFVDPEVLIVDEILSVGDEHFTRKSRAKMEEFKSSGRTIVLVTHDLGTVEKWCDLAAWIDDGRIAEFGDPARVVAAYRQRVAEREMVVANEESGHLAVGSNSEAAVEPAPVAESQSCESVGSDAPEEPPPTEPVDLNRWGNQRVTITSVRLKNASGETQVFDTEDPLTVEIQYRAQPNVTDVGFGIGIHRSDGVYIYGTNTFIERIPAPVPLAPEGVVCFEAARLGLTEGNFSLDVAAHSKDGIAYDYQKGSYSFAVRSGLRDAGVSRLPHGWRWKEEHEAPLAPVALPAHVAR